MCCLARAVATTTGRTIRKSTITPPKAPGTAWTIFLRDYSKVSPPHPCCSSVCGAVIPPGPALTIPFTLLRA